MTERMVKDADALAKKSTQDILDRLGWLEGRVVHAAARADYWQRIDERRGEQIAACRVILRDRGIVDVTRR